MKSPFKAGDKVKIIVNKENGIKLTTKYPEFPILTLIPVMLEQSGLIGEVFYRSSDYPMVKIENNPISFYWHPGWLEKIEVSEKVSNSSFNYTCPKCKGRAYLGLNQVECPNCGRY